VDKTLISSYGEHILRSPDMKDQLEIRGLVQDRRINRLYSSSGQLVGLSPTSASNSHHARTEK